ncbi:hypothetical protein [Usitatibacter rugosus]|nr:hypothetical protein [Usitatibacter rugosus]
MISSHTPQSRRGSWLQRLAMLASGLAVATLATAGSVSITGTVNASCASWSSVSGDGSNISYVCGTSQSTTGGSFTLNVPGSLDVSSTYQSSASNVSVSRSNGTAAIDVTIAGNAGCTPDVTTLSWIANENSTKGVGITTTTGTCTLQITVPTGGSGSTSKNITLADPNAAVAFAFELPSLPSTSFGAPSTVIKVKRSGGSQGDWSVPYLLNGFLSSATAGSVTPSSGSSGAALNFPAGSSEASITFTPVGSQPAGFSLPAAGSIQLQAPIKTGGGGSSTVPALTDNTRTININAVAGCPNVENLKTFVFQGSGQQTFPSLAPGQIGTYAMPIPLSARGKANIIKVAGGPTTADLEIWFSTCPGNTADPLREQVQEYGLKPCKVNYNYNGGNLYWNKSAGDMQTCYLPDSGGPYYFNYRHVKVGNTLINSCIINSCPNVGSFSNQ